MKACVRGRRAAALGACLAVPLFAGAAGGAHAAAPAGGTSERVHASATTQVTPWISTTLDAIAQNRVNPPRAARALALISVAMWDAHRTERGAAESIAVRAAAETVFRGLFGTAPGGAAPSKAGAPQARGVKIGKRILNRGRNDGSSAVFEGKPPSGAGSWVPTPPAFAAPAEPMAGKWRPWNLRSGKQFRPGPPPEYGSARFKRETQAVYDLTNPLAPARAQVADFWNDGPGTTTPAGHWNRIAVGLLAANPRSPATIARLFATLNTAAADAFIACWEAKFKYWLVRPVTVIQRLDAAWQPHIVTPPFPSYPSGHSTVSAAAARVLAAFFPRMRSELGRMAREAGRSRIYGGIHFPMDNTGGATLGRDVAGAALRRWVRR